MTELHRDTALVNVDDARRARLRRLVIKGAFASPVIASFAMSGLTVEKAAAQTNTTGSKLAGSDRRLKTDIVRVASDPRGFGLYRFRYIWSRDVVHVGVMAQEVREVVPEAVVCGEDGFLRVDYGKIGVEMQSIAA